MVIITLFCSNYIHIMFVYYVQPLYIYIMFKNMSKLYPLGTKNKTKNFASMKTFSLIL